MVDLKLIHRIKLFSGEDSPTVCEHAHQLTGTGAIFYQSVGLLQCSVCRGWQFIRKPVK